MLLKGVFLDMEPETVVNVEEEKACHMVALGYDDSVFVGQIAERGKSGAKHGVGRYKPVSARGVKIPADLS